MKVVNRFNVVFPNFAKASAYQDLQDKINRKTHPKSESRIGVMDRGRFFVSFILNPEDET